MKIQQHSSTHQSQLLPICPLPTEPAVRHAYSTAATHPSAHTGYMPFQLQIANGKYSLLEELTAHCFNSSHDGAVECPAYSTVQKILATTSAGKGVEHPSPMELCLEVANKVGKDLETEEGGS
jgi:hypothetical protein